MSASESGPLYDLGARRAAEEGFSAVEVAADDGHPDRLSCSTPSLFGARGGTSPAETAQVIPLVLDRPVLLLEPEGRSEAAKPSEYPLKRTVDIVASTLALVFLAPLMILVALLVWVLDPGPVIYVQDRIGFGGKRFRIFKFRTMDTRAEDMLTGLLTSDPVSLSQWNERQKLSSDPRVTRFGYFLRMSSIDELPQLLNVLKGDMSLVGPRPIVASERVRYGRHFSDYSRLRPGITGLWQVSGRNNTTYRRRVALDVTYGRRMSLAFDLKIMWNTLPAIVEAEGCY